MVRFLKLPLHRMNVLFLILEALLLFGTVIVAASIRLWFDPMDLDHYIQKGLYEKAALVTLVCMIVLQYHDLMFHVTHLRRRWMGLQLLQAYGISTLMLFVFYYWAPDLSLGRGIFFLTMPLTLLVSFVTRLVYLRLTDNPNFGENILIIGSAGVARMVGKELIKKTDLGYRVAGFIDENPAMVGKTVLNPKVVGSYEDVGKIIKRKKIKTVIVALPDRRGKLPVQALLQCKMRGVKVLDGISFYESVTGKISVEGLKPSWLIFSDGFSRPEAGRFAKRILDIGVSVFALIGLLPLLPIVALLIKLDSRGPVFYMQERVGQRGRPFTLVKFRSMRVDAEELSGPAWAKKNDPRVTRVGRILRRMRIDEFPQFWNVLRGEMSLVGPRPERPNFDKELGEDLPYYTLRLSVKPGITGWAQIRYRYGSSVEDALEKLQYDLYYIKHMSIVFDMVIILQTIKIVLLWRGGR